MAKPLSFGHIEVGLSAGAQAAGAAPRAETPFRVALLGDWSRRAGPGARRLADRESVPIDRDNFEQVLARFGVEPRLPGTGEEPTPLRFTTLEDFHPDRLLQRIQRLQALMELRARLGNPATFEAAAAQLRSRAPAQTAADVPAPAPERQPRAPEPSSEGPDNLLDQILGETQGRSGPVGQPAGAGGWDAYLQKIIEPYLLPKVDEARRADLLAQMDRALGQQLRAVLHSPVVQAAEAAWRGLFFLVRRLETDADLQLHLLDVTKEELAADLGSAEDLRATGTYRLLVERTTGTPGGQPWALLVGHYTFDRSRQDAELLGRFAKVACAAGAPFLAAASPRVVGCDSLAHAPDPDDWHGRATPEDDEAWETLRRLPEAAYLGLAFPRFLLRLPYGKGTDPIEQSDFEEMPGGCEHERLLWGNPALACTCLLGEAFRRYGWGFRPGVVQELDGLPLYVYQEAGESQVQPCAEAWLTDRASEAILGQGLMPLLSVKGRDAVRLSRFQSLAGPRKPLAGRWGP
jgi:type VI secretion system protein ImpC